MEFRRVLFRSWPHAVGRSRHGISRENVIRVAPASTVCRSGDRRTADGDRAMIRRLIPFPLLTLALLAMWILLTGFSPGHVLFGAPIAVMVSRPLLSPVGRASGRGRVWQS